MNKQYNYTNIIKETLILTVAVGIIGAAVYFFLVPSHTSVSSISGLGIILSNFIPLPLSVITMILKCRFIDYWLSNLWQRIWCKKSVYTSIMLPVFLAFFRNYFSKFCILSQTVKNSMYCATFL